MAKLGLDPWSNNKSLGSFGELGKTNEITRGNEKKKSSNLPPFFDKDLSHFYNCKRRENVFRKEVSENGKNRNRLHFHT